MTGADREPPIIPQADAEAGAEAVSAVAGPPAMIDARRMTAERRMLESLVCPLTQGRLEWDSTRQELISRQARLAFPVRDGIPIMLAGEARATED